MFRILLVVFWLSSYICYVISGARISVWNGLDPAEEELQHHDGEEPQTYKINNLYLGNVARFASSAIRSTTLSTTLREPEMEKTENKIVPSWHYNDETKWPGRRCREGGTRQSPIDIKTKDVITDFSKTFIKYGPLVFRGYDKVLLSGYNNGYTVQFITEGVPLMHPMLRGGPLKNNYRLEQIHLHWMSEHAIDGDKFPVEIHFVHVQTHMSVNEALSNREGLAIVAVFCDVNTTVHSENLSDEHDPPYEMMEYIPKLLRANDRVSGLVIDISQLLSPNREFYYTYSGSLTTPQCNEVVTWIVFKKPIYISEAQYKVIQKIGDGHHNSRSLQDTKHHKVYTPPNDKKPATPFVVMFENIVNGLNTFFHFKSASSVTIHDNTLFTSSLNKSNNQLKCESPLRT